MLTNLEILALSRAVDGKLVRDEVSVGSHMVDFTVRVCGEIKVGKDTEKVPTVSIPVKEVLALFIARSGATRQSAIALLRECMTLALDGGSKGSGAIDAHADIDQVFREEVSKLTASLPKTPVKGQVRADLTVTRV